MTIFSDKARLPAGYGGLVSQHQRGALAEPGLEFRIECIGVEQRAGFGSVVLRSIEYRPPAAAGGRDNLRQALAGIAVGYHFDCIVAGCLQTIEKRLDIALAGCDWVAEHRVSGNRSEGQKHGAQILGGNEGIFGFPHVARGAGLE